MIHTVKGFGIVNRAEIDVFLELSCFFDNPVDVGNLISGSSAFSKSSLNIWIIQWNLYIEIIHWNLDYTVEVRNRFKGLDLIDRVPKERWTEVRDIVQEAGLKTIPKKKKCKKAKWLSEEALQIAVKRKEKGKGEKERYSHLNAELEE